ncbi:hypothetical protein BP6252_09639 [Coleophoma cylindrospora]|uniref:DUF7702 domain-containing protein n=1 Tax=Coleophoma cylindrospora TaxID=1849047 RepID=A0A3D8QWT9_9HELO|nr:hypothetical protein BP6252_09639 [Coleophoma cylindrospora]
MEPYTQIAIAELVFFSLCLIPTTIILLHVKKHKRFLSSFHFLLFIILRIICAALLIAAIPKALHTFHILQIAGTALLLLTLQAIIHEMLVRETTRERATGRRILDVLFGISLFITWAMFALVIVAGFTIDSSHHDSSPVDVQNNDWVTASQYWPLFLASLKIFIIAIFTSILGLCFLTVAHISQLHGRRFFGALICSVLLMMPRTAYSFFSVLSARDSEFAAAGDVEYFIGLAMAEEFIISLLFVIAGVLILEKPKPRPFPDALGDVPQTLGSSGVIS